MYTVKAHATSMKWPHEEICPPPFRCLIVAPSGGGKSVLISSMLNFEPYKKLFKKNIFFFSPTMKEDPEYAHLEIKDENVFDTYNSDVLLDLYDSQRTAKKYLKKNKELEHVCVVLDDLVTDLPSNQKSLLSKLFMTGRHLNISIIIATQSYKLISRTIRMNLTCLICLHCNQGEVKKISEESAASNFIDLHAQCVSEPYGFIHEVVAKPLEHRFRNKFTLEYLDAK